MTRSKEHLTIPLPTMALQGAAEQHPRLTRIHLVAVAMLVVLIPLVAELVALIPLVEAETPELARGMIRLVAPRTTIHSAINRIRPEQT